MSLSVTFGHSWSRSAMFGRGPGGDLRRRFRRSERGGGRLRGAVRGPLFQQSFASPAGGGGDVGRVAKDAPPGGVRPPSFGLV
eukprot:1173152-Prorocentrum_minimum.AAC.1